MDFNPTTLYIISGILVGIILILSYIIINLLKKVEKYEDITVEQADYMNNISNLLYFFRKFLNQQKNPIIQELL